jgi:hypothetical protein
VRHEIRAGEFRQSKIDFREDLLAEAIQRGSQIGIELSLHSRTRISGTPCGDPFLLSFARETNLEREQRSCRVWFQTELSAGIDGGVQHLALALRRCDRLVVRGFPGRHLFHQIESFAQRADDCADAGLTIEERDLRVCNEAGKRRKTARSDTEQTRWARHVRECKRPDAWHAAMNAKGPSLPVATTGPAGSRESALVERCEEIEEAAHERRLEAVDHESFLDARKIGDVNADLVRVIVGSKTESVRSVRWCLGDGLTRRCP